MQQVLNMEERIQAYIDKECNEEERLFIEQKINNDESWSRLYRSMQAMHELLSIGLETMEPSMRFSKNVMEEVAGLQIAKPTRQYLNPMVHWLVGGVLVSMLIVIIGYAISLADWSATGSATNLNLPELKIPAVNWGSYVNNNTTLLFWLLNTILGFALIDKWLRRKKSFGTALKQP